MCPKGSCFRTVCPTRGNGNPRGAHEACRNPSSRVLEATRPGSGKIVDRTEGSMPLDAFLKSLQLASNNKSEIEHVESNHEIPQVARNDAGRH
jgi:hypothetical protein